MLKYENVFSNILYFLDFRIFMIIRSNLFFDDDITHIFNKLSFTSKINISRRDTKNIKLLFASCNASFTVI